MKKIYKAALILIGTLGWWGFVYPDLCLTEDVYKKEAEADDNRGEDVHTEDLLRDGVQLGELRIKSRAAEYVYQVKKKYESEKESEND